ncbi:MAG: hypothetical protein MCS20_01260, partial [Candidatus Phytoplasma mali]|nr:hypothetical protein [Candidatus Phytoplasma australiense]MCG7202027.1 hypothetical protein [Candidatus Phytoplasma mali]
KIKIIYYLASSLLLSSYHVYIHIINIMLYPRIVLNIYIYIYIYILLCCIINYIINICYLDKKKN